MFPYTYNLSVLEVPRGDDFSPLKNAPGSSEDSPETSRRDIMAQHQRFLKSVGAHLLPDGKGVFEVELSPLVTYAGENLHRLSGLTLQCPILINTERDIDDLIAKSKKN